MTCNKTSYICILFVCWGLTEPACSSGNLTNVLPHRNATPQTQDMTPHPVTVYGHRYKPLVVFFVPSTQGREARFLHRSHQEPNPGPSHSRPLHYRCATPASLRTKGLPVVVLSIDVERHTGIQNYPF